MIIRHLYLALYCLPEYASSSGCIDSIEPVFNFRCLPLIHKIFVTVGYTESFPDGRAHLNSRLSTLQLSNIPFALHIKVLLKSKFVTCRSKHAIILVVCTQSTGLILECQNNIATVCNYQQNRVALLVISDASIHTAPRSLLTCVRLYKKRHTLIRLGSLDSTKFTHT